MSKGRRTRILILVLVTIALLAVMIYSLLPDSQINQSTSTLSFIFRPIERVVSSVKSSFSDYFRTNRVNRELQAENERLKEENVNLRLEIKANEVSAKEYDKLKQAFQLIPQYDYATIEASRILQRPSGPGFDLYRIDKGKEQNIDPGTGQGFAAISAEGYVFGRIYRSDASSSKVLALTHEGFSASCHATQDSGQSFVLRGDLSLKERNLCLLDEIPANASISKGDLIVTSGTGGIFPYGLELGRVSEILPLNQYGYRQAIVEPSVNLSEIDVVFVLAGRYPVDADQPAGGTSQRE